MNDSKWVTERREVLVAVIAQHEATIVRLVQHDAVQDTAAALRRQAAELLARAEAIETRLQRDAAEYGATCRLLRAARIEQAILNKTPAGVDPVWLRNYITRQLSE